MKKRKQKRYVGKDIPGHNYNNFGKNPAWHTGGRSGFWIESAIALFAPGRLWRPAYKHGRVLSREEINQLIETGKIGYEQKRV